MNGTNDLQITKNLSLPIDLITRRVAVIGMSGSGKSNTAGVLAEKMLAIGAQVAILDNDGSWYGLRLGADGSNRGGFDIPIFGGDHGDIPLDYRSGALVADVIVDRGISVVLDISDMHKNKRRQFATDFAEQLYSRKKSKRSPMMFIIEEAEEFLPQRFGKDQAVMVGAFEDITKRGRKYGIGSMMISQRPQSINKEGLNQAEIIFAHYVAGTQERKAMSDWLTEKHGEVDLVQELPYLQLGEAFVWSPRWIGAMLRVFMPLKKTFDSARTPEFGEEQITTVLKLDPGSLEQIRIMMGEAVKQAEENNPAILKKRIADLERQLQKRPAVIQPEIQYQEIKVSISEEISALREIYSDALTLFANMMGVSQDLETAIILAQNKLADINKQPARFPVIKTESAPGSSVKKNLLRSAPDIIPGDMKIQKAERTLLTVLAQYPDGRTINQAATLAGYAVRKGFRNAVSSCRTKGLLIGSNERLQITDQGLSVLGSYEPLPTGQELIDYWMNKLGKAERAAFYVLVSNYDAMLTKEQIADQAGYDLAKGFRNALSRLNTLELSVTENGLIGANPVLFE